ncbi:hypothetical protein B9Z19DRAFT_1130357 [Tuber borchii]|uniref:Uncharacterized protein n=1 Tax=Tuber borchii TaxID=42251 RepID=A0A2T6ZKN3_TUBBO|nr:hypothetical protein B9Z19DRAFT_1130357 [Tuber borchii]
MAKILEDDSYIYAGEHQGWYSLSGGSFYPWNSLDFLVDLESGRKQQHISIEKQKIRQWTE